MASIVLQSLALTYFLFLSNVPHVSAVPSLAFGGVHGTARDVVVAAALDDVASTGFATQNGGTSGGKKGPTVTVSTLPELQSAVAGNEPRIVLVSGTIEGAAKTRVGSNKSIIGLNSSSQLIGNGFFIWKQKNVIIRNLKISKVQAHNGDAITVQNTTNVWIDHCNLSSDQDHGKDYYDGLLDITHGSDLVTVSDSHFHDHFKASLVGHSNKNGNEDTGHLRVTYFNNLWTNIHSRTPSLRFGTAHIFNSYFQNVVDGINTRQGAQVLVEGNIFVNSTKPLYSTKEGFAIARGNDFGSVNSTALQGNLTAVPYPYRVKPLVNVISNENTAGNILAFSGNRI